MPTFAGGTAYGWLAGRLVAPGLAGSGYLQGLRLARASSWWTGSSLLVYFDPAKESSLLQVENGRQCVPEERQTHDRKSQHLVLHARPG